MGKSRRWWQHIIPCIEIGLILGGLLCIFLFVPRSIEGDSLIRYKDVVGFLEHHILNGSWSRNAKYSLYGPLFATPLYLIDNATHHTSFWTALYNFSFFVGTLILTYICLYKRIDRSLLRRFFLVLITASMFPAHLGFFNAEVFSALMIGFGFFFTSGRLLTPLSWLAIALGVANTPALLAALGLTVLKQVSDTQRLRYMLIFVISIGLILLEAQLRRGNMFAHGYNNDAGGTTILPYSGQPGFSYPFYLGLLSLLFSFGKGLLYFVPGLLLPVKHTLQKLHRTDTQVDVYRIYTWWCVFVIGMILTYASWWAWYGGLFWGPRFFLFASIPASFALTARLYDRDGTLPINVLTLFVLLLSLWIGINGALFQNGTEGTAPVCITQHYTLEFLCLYVPEFSPLWYPFVANYAVSNEQWIYIAYSLFVGFYLATPLLVRIGQQAYEVIKQQYYEHAELKTWRF